MIYSKFKVRSIIFVVSITLGLIIVSLLILFNYQVKSDIVQNVLASLVGLSLIYIIMQMLFGELRSKAIKVELLTKEINKMSFVGIGFKTNFLYKDIEGYKTSIVSSRSGDYEYLYLIVKSKRAIKLSEFYHDNYKELKRDIIKKGIRNIGIERWTIFTEIKDMFSL